MLTNSNMGGGSLELNCHKSKGFTLIELISVIILMGVIALITVPIIKDTMESAREKNFKNSAIGLIEAANEYYLNSKLTGDYFEEIEFKVNNGKMISGDKELSFNGRVPVGDSYVKIKANGDVAINITDGEFYAVKDYDEIGASIGTSEESALLREELIKKINELEKKVENNKNELDNKIENNTTNINKNAVSINNNTTSISNLTNKENSNNVFLKTYPVGSIYISTSNTNPSTIYGGTWERYGRGKTLVGLNESETEFSEVNKIGGEKTHTLTIDEMPSHFHAVSAYTDYVGDDANTYFEQNRSLTNTLTPKYGKYWGTISNSAGGSQSHNNLQPYITVYMWKRVS